MNGALLTLWRLWDFFYYHCTRLTFVDKDNHNIFRVVTKKYRGQTLQTEGQAVISAGDRYIKLHIHNCLLANQLRGVTGEVRLGIVALKEVRNSLPALAKYIEEHPQADQIKGVVGTTILYRGARPLGFHVQNIETPLVSWFKTAFFKFILSWSRSGGLARVRHHSDRLTAKRVFMSKEELLKRYLGE